MKKARIFFLMVLLVLCVSTAAAAAEYTVYVGGHELTVNDTVTEAYYGTEITGGGIPLACIMTM